MFVFPENSHVEVLISSVAVFGDGASQELRINEVIRVEPWSNRIRVHRIRVLLRKEISKRYLFPSLPAPTHKHTHTCIEKRPCEAITRRPPCISQEESPHQKPTLPNPNLGLLSSRTMKK